MMRLTLFWCAVQPRRGQRGQTLIILAFLSVFLLTLLGLVIDTVRLYILSAQAERAAEAGALAGALYMPTYFSETAPAPDGESAQKRACEALQQNGVTTCFALPGQVGAQIAPVAGNPYELQVTVTLQAEVFFLAYVSPNLASATVSRTALAEFLPPIELGSRTSYFGDQADGKQSFWASINGPLDLKEQGDAYSPKWEEGPTDPQKYPDGGSSSFNRWTPKPCCTNHQQWGTPITNPDQQPSGFTGYNYQIVVPPGSGSIQVQIYNPAFIYDTSCPFTGVVPAKSTGDRIDIDAAKDPAFGCAKTDKKNEYMQMTYSLYSVPLLFERSADQLVPATQSQPMPFQPPSLDLVDSLGHCVLTPSTPYWDPQKQACVADPGYIDQWYTLYTIPNSASLQTYRLSVQATGYYGSKNYAVRLTSPGNIAPPAGVRVFAWNNMCAYFSLTGEGGDTIFDLAEIPADYAGKTLNFSLFDPGDSSGNVDMKVLDPSGNPVQLVPSSYTWIRTTNNRTELEASIGGDHIYNGLWLQFPITIPGTYNPAAGQDWWQIEYLTPNGAPTDKITISVTLSGSPVHLISLIP
jgi:Flp pilus assembly protein TadG